ncbi:methyltransferase domain-containing protein [Paeniglutamicibacter psychrophenolicus]|uniref:methyltransferase domain-containing protein n=1 Tax=Paeniglutamicibacter psychrophenolicus TaxID=257454 RepID=UPI0027811A15|nr:class I SAM-dependent methyltransferase [Paeniglutamicibacter psychrophenolicus]MDQ0096139.1 SAM-dependent methyltransferase [Paeniglutamicibacter psychrophenolicus]
MRSLLRSLARVQTSRKVGHVERYEKQGIDGRIRLPKGVEPPVYVELFINETLVLKAPVVPNGHDSGTFKIGVYDVWRFAKRTDRVSVRYAGHSLVMPNGELFSHPAKDGKENEVALKRRLASGQAFDLDGKVTHLPKDLDHTWQDGVLSLYQVVDRVIQEVTGSKSFIYSGTLLGYVRNNGFIPHDKDMDCAYVSKEGSPSEVASEFAALGEALIAAGYQVTPKASCISVRESTGSKVMVDIAHLFVKADGCIGFPFGTVGMEAVPPQDFEPVGTGQLSGFSVGIPASPTAVVAHVYGEGWGTPDPDFKWSERRQRRDAQALLSYAQRSRIAMDDFYSRPADQTPSTFAHWLVGSGLVPKFARVVDIGCGNGRDLFHLQGLATEVVGLDRSDYAVRAAQTRVHSASEIFVERGDALVPGTIGALATKDRSEAQGRVLYYHRFFLNGLTASEEDVLFAELAASCTPGDYVAFEHRTDQDKDLKKALFRSYRRFVSPAETVASLEAHGMAIVHCEADRGLASYGREDPHVVRIIAKRV